MNRNVHIVTREQFHSIFCTASVFSNLSNVRRRLNVLCLLGASCPVDRCFAYYLLGSSSAAFLLFASPPSMSPLGRGTELSCPCCTDAFKSAGSFTNCKPNAWRISCVLFDEMTWPPLEPSSLLHNLSIARKQPHFTTTGVTPGRGTNIPTHPRTSPQVRG